MSDIRLIELSKYIKPAIVENKSKGWVLNGVNNEFYDYIIARNNGSVTNSAINKSYIDLMYGRGIGSREASMYPAQWAQVVSLMKPRELRKIVADFQLFGEMSVQCVKTRDRKKIAGAYHLPKNKVVPAIENDKGEIESYFYSKDWSKSSIIPTEYAVLGTSNDEIEIFVCRPYAAGREYFAEPDYLAGLQYAELEEELSNFYINCVRNGLSAGYIINVPDGQTLTPEEKNELELKIKQKLTGSPNAQKFIINFASKDAEITVIPFPVNERQHQQWETLTNQARQQIMTAHRVVSPKLFGIMADGGLGNNANELDEAEAQMLKRVIAPKQQYILDALEEIFDYNDITIPLHFKPLTEAPDTGVRMSAERSELDNFIELGEQEFVGYDIVDEIEVDYDEEDLLQLASTGTAIPNAKSEQDGADYIVRYRYVGSASPDRPFCQKMMQAGKLYRKEDIIAMENKTVNPGWGAGGSNTYSIWLYKGGGNCYHKWNRVIFAKKGVKIDANSPLAKVISTSEARRRGLKVPTNDSDVSIAPIRMPNQGFLNK